MTTKQEATARISAAEKACSLVHTEHQAALAALDRGTNINALGIYMDRFEVRNNLEEAQAHIQAALKVLKDVDWPTDADYDQF